MERETRNQNVKPQIPFCKGDSDSINANEDAYSEVMDHSTSFHNFNGDSNSVGDFCKLSDNVTDPKDLHESVLVSLDRNAENKGGEGLMDKTSPINDKKEIEHIFDENNENSDKQLENTPLVVLNLKKKVFNDLVAFFESKGQHERADEFKSKADLVEKAIEDLQAGKQQVDNDDEDIGDSIRAECEDLDELVLPDTHLNIPNEILQSDINENNTSNPSNTAPNTISQDNRQNKRKRVNKKGLIFFFGFFVVFVATLLMSDSDEWSYSDIFDDYEDDLLYNDHSHYESIHNSIKNIETLKHKKTLNPIKALKLCKLYETTGDYFKATDCYESLIGDPELLKHTHMGLYRVYRDLNNNLKAEEHLHAYIDIEPEDIRANINLANLYKRSHKPTQAIRHLNFVVQANTLNSYAYFQLFYLYKEQADVQKAIEVAFNYLKIHPNDRKFKHNLSLLYSNNGLYPQAIELLKQLATEDDRDVIALNNYANLICETEENKKAFEIYDEAIAADLSISTALLNKARCFELLGDDEKALLAVKEAIGIDNYDISARTLAALLYKSMDKAKEAIRMLIQAIKINPEAVEPLILLSDILIDNKRFEEADGYLHSALKMEPENALVLFNLGKLYNHNGQYEVAKQYLDRAFNQNKSIVYHPLARKLVFMETQ